MSATVLELNVSAVCEAGTQWLVSIPGRAGAVQRYWCATHAVAMRLLRLFSRPKPQTARRLALQPLTFTAPAPTPLLPSLDWTPRLVTPPCARERPRARLRVHGPLA